MLAAQKNEAERTRGELETALAKAERDLGFTTITAPFDGVVGNKAAELGEYVQPGARLLALVPLASAYVDANFKETQLGSIHPGQKVDVAVDAFDGRAIEGVVTSVAPASGSQFSLLPPDNATGNFTKVVQRVAVRIALPAEALQRATLRPGLSVVATVHTRDESLPKPTLLGALGLELRRKAARAKRQAVSAARRPPAPAPRAAAPARRPKRWIRASSWRSSSWCSACSWRFWTSRSSRLRCREIQAGLSASSDEITWVQTSYLIAEVIMIPLSGFLSRALFDPLSCSSSRRRASR